MNGDWDHYDHIIERALVAFIALMLLMVLATQLGHWAGRTLSHHAPIRCEEDMPCWDCTIMGNHICGPVAP